MTTEPMRALLRRLRADGPAGDESRLGDAELLAGYLAAGDPAALEALVRRHAATVWGVCRRALAEPADAEDAFQATFLVFVRKAASIASPDRLGPWLYGVAALTARKVRDRRARLRARERQAEPMPDPPAAEAGDEAGLDALRRALATLPEMYRAAVVLCDLEGRTRREAAGLLNVPEGTLAARVARGRALLARRLARRGPDAPPAVLLASTINAAGPHAAGPAAGVSPAVAALTREVLKMMPTSKLPIAAAAVVALAAAVVLSLAGLRESALPRATAAPLPKDKSAWHEAFTRKHDHAVTAVACSAEVVAAGDAGGNVFLYAAKTGKDAKQALIGGKSFQSIDRLQVQSDGKYLWAVVNGRKDMWQIDLGKVGRAWGAFGNLGVSADAGLWLEAKVSATTLHIRPNLNRMKDGIDIDSAVRFKAKVVDAVLSPDSKRLAVRTEDELRVFDRAALKRDNAKRPEGTLIVKQKVTAFAFSADGKHLAVVGPGGLAKVYDAATGKERATLKGHRGAVHAVAYSPDGKTLATGGADLSVRLWTAADGKAVAALEGHEEAIRSIAFGPKGDRMVTGSDDKTVKVWRVKR